MSRDLTVAILKLRFSFLILGTLAGGGIAEARQSHYSFVKIADTAEQPSIAATTCVGLSDSGTVVFGAARLFRGDANRVTIVAPWGGPGAFCPSINDLDEIAYIQSDGFHNYLVENTNGSETVLATFPVDLNSNNWTYLPSLSNTQSALYETPAAGIYIAPSGPTVYDPGSSGSPFDVVAAGTINDGLVATFAARKASDGTLAIYRGGTLVPFVAANGNSTPAIFPHPVINKWGTIAFVSVTAGVSAAMKTDDGISFTQVSAQMPIGGLSLNDSGAAAYTGYLGSAYGIFAGPNVILDKVIGPGDPLDGSTYVDGQIWPEALNNQGQIAFWARLADGRYGIYRADPDAPTSTALQALPASTVFGQMVSLTATVSANAAVPTGSAQFLDGASSLGTVALNGGGVAQFSTSSLEIGTHSLKATYPGDTGFQKSESATVAVTVSKANSSVAIVATPNPVKKRQPIQIIVTVSAQAPGGGTPSGSVRLMNGKKQLGSASLTNGSAAFQLTFSSPGDVTVNATYGGDPHFNGQTSTDYIIHVSK